MILCLYSWHYKIFLCCLLVFYTTFETCLNESTIFKLNKLPYNVVVNPYKPHNLVSLSSEQQKKHCWLKCQHLEEVVVFVVCFNWIRIESESERNLLKNVVVDSKYENKK